MAGYDVVFNGPGGAKMLYNGNDPHEAQRICSQVLQHNPGLKAARNTDDGVVAQWDDPRNALMMQMRERR